MATLAALVYREEQRSLLNEERSEVRALFRLAPDGWLRVDADYHKRDADTEYYSDTLTVDDIDALRVDEAMWDMTPEHVKPTEEIEKVIVMLADWLLTD